MSFVDNTKIVGWAFFIIGIIMVISALLQFVDAFDYEDTMDIVGVIIGAIGALIAAVIYFLYGNKVRVGEIDGKMHILTSYVSVVGYATVISALFSAIGGILCEALSFWDAVISFIFGLVLLWVAKKMGDDKQETIDKIIWILLLIIFIVLFILALCGILDGGWLNIIASICYAIVYIFMIAYILDNDVKKAMGM